MPWPELVAASTGTLLVAVALLWRWVTRRRLRRAVRRALDDPDPVTRCAGVTMAAERGLSRSAGLVLDLVRRERDPGVRNAVAEMVARHEWEPADGGELLELRLWATRWLDPGRAFRESLEPWERGAVWDRDRGFWPGLADPDARRFVDMVTSTVGATHARMHLRAGGGYLVACARNGRRASVRGTSDARRDELEAAANAVTEGAR